MFDHAVSRPSSPRWKTALLLVTVGTHAAVVIALVLAAFWKIEKVSFAERYDVAVAVMPPLPPPGGPPPGAKLKVERRVAAKVKPPVPVQPIDVPPPVDDPAVKTGGGPTGPDTGGGGDNPDGDPESTEIGTGICASPPCGEAPLPKPPVKVEVKVPPPITIVPPSVAAGLRTSGDTQLYPPDRVKQAMMRADQDMVRGTFKLCISTSGAVDSVRVMSSTGHADYDAELVRGMERWRYRPYTVNGVPAPMCTVQIMVYRIKP